MKLPRMLFLSLLLALLTTGNPLHGQTLNPTPYRQVANSNEILQKTKTAPFDDAVLNSAPTELGLEFPHQVRLVKLTLRNDKRDWVDIDFRYSPRLQASFIWNLPVLDPASYYTADWAILAANDELIRGSFSFSFGPDAKPPSIVREAHELLLQLRYGDPNVRSVMPPRTEIIINRDPPQYDPPFTIKLENPATRNPG